MGLDMYLYRRLSPWYDHDVVVDKKFRKLFGITEADAKVFGGAKVSKVTLELGYWRKANAIHRWFVDNVQDGSDDCKEYLVGNDQLIELRQLCEELLRVYETGDDKKFVATVQERLPPQAGFFFGSTEVDEGYVADLKRTVEILKDVVEDDHYEKAPYYKKYVYYSSW